MRAGGPGAQAAMDAREAARSALKRGAESDNVMARLIRDDLHHRPILTPPPLLPASRWQWSRRKG
jgi:hypothetical protein